MNIRRIVTQYLIAVLGAYALLELIGICSWLVLHTLYLRWSALVIGFLLAALWFGSVAPAHKRLWLVAALLFAPVPIGVYLLTQPLVWRAAERVARYQMQGGYVPHAIWHTLQESAFMTVSAVVAYVVSVAVVWGVAAWRLRRKADEVGRE
jgi:hypothetical protein